MKNEHLAVIVRKYIMTVSDEIISGLAVKTLSYQFKIDRYKLTRAFKQETGLTLEEFLFREKMMRAAFLLRDGRYDITVKEVSRRMGYCTSDYFIRRFKAFYGVAPGSFRELKMGQHEKGLQEKH